MKDFTAKEQIFLLDIMIGNLWLLLDRTSLHLIKTFWVLDFWIFLSTSIKLLVFKVVVVSRKAQFCRILFKAASLAQQSYHCSPYSAVRLARAFRLKVFPVWKYFQSESIFSLVTYEALELFPLFLYFWSLEHWSFATL